MKSVPAIRGLRCETVCSAGVHGKGRYLTLHELQVQNEHLDGTVGRTYSYECLTRKYIDAVVLVLHAQMDGCSCVCLRASLRPPLILRSGLPLAVPEDEPRFWLWELPAGLIEPESDRGQEGIARRAAFEAFEETGYRIAAERFQILSGAPFLSPGVLPERIHFAVAEIQDVATRSEASGDGSAVEEGAVIEWVPLMHAIAMCDAGAIVDAKTELGLRRFSALRTTATS